MMLKAFFNQLFDYIGKIGVLFIVISSISMALKDTLNFNSISILLFIIGIIFIVASSVFIPKTKE